MAAVDGDECPVVARESNREVVVVFSLTVRIEGWRAFTAALDLYKSAQISRRALSASRADDHAHISPSWPVQALNA